MGKALSEDLRQRIVKCIKEEGFSARGAAKRFGVSPRSAINLINRYRLTGSISKKTRTKYRDIKLFLHKDFLEGLIGQQPSITLKEIREELLSKGLSVCTATIWHFLNRLNYSYKKNGIRKRTRAS